jgi:hypothetical protein
MIHALRWYHFDPFAYIGKEQATVGALRKAAEGHDVSTQTLTKHEHGIRSMNALIDATNGNTWSRRVNGASARISADTR